MARLPNASSLLAIALAAGSVSSVAHAQSWALPVNGSWFVPDNWSPAVVPTGAGAIGMLGLSGAYTVTTTTNTLLGVNVTNGQATLGLLPSYSLTLVGSGPGVVNALNGQIIINSSGSYNGTSLNIGAPAVTFSGSGALRLNASPSDPTTTVGTSMMVGSNGGTLAMNAGTTLAGFGQVASVPTTNNGTFTADVAGRVLLINGGTHQNNNLYTAANGGALILQSDTVTQSGAGRMAPAAGSSVQLANTSVNGGMITSLPTGRVQVTSGTSATLSNVIIGGGLDAGANTSTYIGAPGVTLAGGAVVTVNSTSAFNVTTLATGSPDTPIKGNGTIRLAASPSDPAATIQTSCIREDGGTADGSFAFEAGITLAGFGIVSNIPTTNLGVFNADIAGRPLRIDGNVHQNNSLYTATNGGVLVLANAAVNQGPSAVISAVGAAPDTTASNVQLSGTSVTGGSLTSNGTARVQVNAGASATLASVAINGGLDLYQGATTYIDSPGVTLNGGATLLVNTTGTFAVTSLRTADAGTAIGGTGTVRLNASSSDPAGTVGTASLAPDGASPGAFTFASGITLAGFGLVNDIPTTNNGVFNADVSGRPLRVQGGTHQNNGLYTATGGGTLRLANVTVNQGAGARTYAGADSWVVLSSSRINGGTVGSLAGSNGYTSVDNTVVDLEGVSVSRQLTVDPSGTLASASTITLTNNAAVTINTTGTFAGTRLRADGAPTAINGTGLIHLNASTSDSGTTSGTADLSRNGAVTGSGFTLASGIAVDGFGRISDCPTINNGTINANVNGRPLRIENNTHQNNNTYRSSNGGTLWLFGSTINQSSAGVIDVGDASTLSMQSATVIGGAITAAGSGRVVVTTSSHVGNLTSSAPMDVNPGQVLAVEGPGIINNDLITVNPTGTYSGTFVRAGAAGTAVNGSGEVRLNRSNADGTATVGTAELGATAGGNTFVFGADQTLSGSGRLSCPVVMNGLMSPGYGAGNVNFIRNESSATLSFTGNGRLAIDVASTASYDQIVNAGTVSLHGTLQVTSAFNAAPGSMFDVITGGAISGQFDTVVSSGLAAPRRFGARYDLPGKVRVTVLCGAADVGGVGADGNGDGRLDNNDFIIFIDRFFAQNPNVDFGRAGGLQGADGHFDNNDFIAFIDLFFAGCF